MKVRLHGMEVEWGAPYTTGKNKKGHKTKRGDVGIYLGAWLILLRVFSF